ncbi:MAG: 4-hydroxy-tetrahydrodipicolinate synthase [Paludibacteraceae bacterium]|nr:4-hydroxy-tetrahydrodipicolinate synthase [Paludibacteraceae bacterium]
MDKRTLTGLGTALITPFQADGSVDYKSLEQLLDKQLEGYVDYIVVLGTTGEAATLSAEEKKEVRHFIVNYIHTHPTSPLEEGPGEVLPLVLGVGGNNTAAVCSELQTLREELTEDYAAILSVCPYYNKPSQEGLYQHFCAVAEASPIPVILYNVPGRTGVNLLPETVMRIYDARPDKIIGIKEASGNVEQIKDLICKKSKVESQKQFLVISGDDGIACELMEAGADGLISVASNAFAHDFYRIVHQKDSRMQARYEEMIRLLFAEGNPSGIKTVLAAQGIIENILRLPLVSNSKGIQEKIRNELAELGR